MRLSLIPKDRVFTLFQKHAENMHTTITQEDLAAAALHSNATAEMRSNAGPHLRAPPSDRCRCADSRRSTASCRSGSRSRWPPGSGSAR